MDFPAIGVLVAYSAVVGRRAGIQPKQNDSSWLVIPNLWGGIVGNAGSMKTPALKEVMKPIYELDNSDDGNRYIVNDATPEKLLEIMRENPAGLLLTRDEITGLLNTCKKEGYQNARSFYIESWDGKQPYTQDRISRGTVHVDATCLAILGGIQPGPFKKYVYGAKSSSDEADGLLQRFQLLVWPDISDDWFDIDKKPNIKAENRVHKIFKKTSLLPCSLDDKSPGLIFKFNKKSQVIFKNFQKKLEPRIRRSNDHPAFIEHESVEKFQLFFTGYFSNDSVSSLN